MHDAPISIAAIRHGNGTERSTSLLNTRKAKPHSIKHKPVAQTLMTWRVDCERPRTTADEERTVLCMRKSTIETHAAEMGTHIDSIISSASTNAILCASTRTSPVRLTRRPTSTPMTVGDCAGGGCGDGGGGGDGEGETKRL